MDVIHFTQGAADTLNSRGAHGVRFLPLADGEGATHMSCAHLEPGATIDAPSLTHAVALLVVHGRIAIRTIHPDAIIQVHAGMGCMFDQDEPYTIRSEVGAIVLVVESDVLTAQTRGISTPERIAGATWPGDSALGS